jgi:hypothetical protein
VLQSPETARRFSRFVIENEGAEVGSAIVVLLPNPGMVTLAGRLLRAPEDLSLCVVIDRLGVICASEVLGGGNTVPGVLATRSSAAAWIGYSLFQLAQGEAAGVPKGGEETGAAMADLGRTLVRADYGDAVLVRCMAAPAGIPVALRAGDVVPAVEVTSVGGERVNLASFLGHSSVLMNCDPFCGTCFDMTVDLFTRISQLGNIPDTMLVLMQASADSDRGKLLMASLPEGVTVIEDPDNVAAKRMGMNVSAYVVVPDSMGIVAWSRRIATEANAREAISRLEKADSGGS